MVVSGSHKRWGILRVCLLEQTVELMECSVKLTESTSARDLLSYWIGMVHEDQNECGYLVLGDKVLALAEMIGFGQSMSEEEIGIFANDVVDPPYGAYSRLDSRWIFVLLSNTSVIQGCSEIQSQAPSSKVLMVRIHQQSHD